MNIYLLLYLILGGLICPVLIYGMSLSYWWGYCPSFQSETGRKKEIMIRSAGYSIYGLFPILNLVILFMIYFLTEKMKYGFKLKI